MPKFKKYQHIEHLGKPEVADITEGTVYIFPKLDGANASVYWNPKTSSIECSSRNQRLTENNTLKGFWNYVQDNQLLQELVINYPNYIFYGEWLIPHTIQNYRKDAWKKFYIFDAYDTEECRFIEYGILEDIIDTCNSIAITEDQYIELVPCIYLFTNPSAAELQLVADEVDYLCEGETTGEGIVVKRYNSESQIWAKVINSKFKEKKNKSWGVKGELEARIIQNYMDNHFILKEYAKIKVEFSDKEIPKHRFIQMVLSKIFFEFIDENIKRIVKRYKNPTLNFTRLRALSDEQVKRTLTDLFT